MSTEIIAVRRAEAVAALESAGGWSILTSDIGKSTTDMLDVCDAIDTVRAYLDDDLGEGPRLGDIAALHSLALLLAAMTEPT